MLNEFIKLPKPLLGKKFDVLLSALEKGRFSIRRDISLIFLCGANKFDLVPSERRSFIKRAVESCLPHARIVYAEKVMEELVKHGSTKNLLDIEHQISSIADWVLIVLESYSSFCELGAFADKNSRKKLIVVNDENFRKEPSFINHGPIQAISEDASPDQIIWYPMKPDGVHNVDAIGMTLPAILKLVSKRKTRDRLEKEEFLPKNINQNALFFLHDLIYICGPLSHAETIEIYKKIFGSHSFDEIKSLRGVLHASGLLDAKNVDGVQSYISTNPETFIEFGPWMNGVMTAFRRYHMKFNPQRLLP